MSHDEDAHLAEASTTERLRITEIFFSLQGEARSVGWPTVFVRLTGCPLRCQYCDTAYAFSGGKWMSIDSILKEVTGYSAKHVTVTGGEPLAQSHCNTLLSRLCDLGFDVSLETSGAMDVSAVDQRVVKVVDIKTPGSGEEAKNLYQNVQYLNAIDQVKFVICDKADYDWARQVIEKYNLNHQCDVLLSPSYGQIAAPQLADWILEDRLPVRFQMQLHKILWGDVPGK